MASSCAEQAYEYDRLVELRAFDETKAGVKGLLNDGVTGLPPRRSPRRPAPQRHRLAVPVVDLYAVAQGGSRHREIVEQIRLASESWGLFQVVGHSVPGNVLDEVIAGVRRFNEGDGGEKATFYSRDAAMKGEVPQKLRPAPDPRRQLEGHPLLRRGTGPPTLPPRTSRRAEGRSNTGGECQSSGRRSSNCCRRPLDSARLVSGTRSATGGAFCSATTTRRARSRSSPSAPAGTLTPASSPSFYRTTRRAATPPPGPLITNDKSKSVQHRVLANRKRLRGVGVACFFATHIYSEYARRLYGPMKELLSDANPPRYRETEVSDFTRHNNGKGLDGVLAPLHFRL